MGLKQKTLSTGMLESACSILSVPSPVKKPFYRIDLKNCGTDYDYTIVEAIQIDDYVQLVREQAEDLDEEGYNHWKESGYLPEATVTVVMMTDKEFSDWFAKNVKP